MKIIHENIFQSLINEITSIAEKHSSKKMIWCGENAWLYLISEILNEIGVHITAVVDNSSSKIGIKTPFYEIVSFDYCLHNHKDYIFLMANLRSQEIVSQLCSMGIDRNDIYVLRPIEYIIERFEKNYVFDMYDKHIISHKELHGIIFDILKYFKGICEKNNLRYFLYDGTLIGAVRHHGFIPWDDDIDVAMPYEDYIKLQGVFNGEGRYSLISWENDDDYEFSWMKIIDNETRMIHPWNTIIGCYIDIFPIGGYPSENTRIEQKWSQYIHAEKVWQSYYILRDTRIGAIDTRRRIIDELFDIPFNDAKYVGIMRKEKQKPWVAPREWFEPVDVIFCNERFMAPIGYESYLKMKYGDYMAIPEVNKREIHGFKAWKI